MHVDAGTNPAVWGAIPGAAFRGRRPVCCDRAMRLLLLPQNPLPIRWWPAHSPRRALALCQPALLRLPVRRQKCRRSPLGAQAAYGFHSGLNNAAIASNGNTLSRDAFGNTYNYPPNST